MNYPSVYPLHIKALSGALLDGKKLESLERYRVREVGDPNILIVSRPDHQSETWSRLAREHLYSSPWKRHHDSRLQRTAINFNCQACLQIMASDQTRSIVRVAAVQAEGCYFDLPGAVEKTCCLIEEAAGKGCDLVAFPELWIPMYPGWIW